MAGLVPAAGRGPGHAYDVSYCNLAVVGATSSDVLRAQLDDAVAHRPDLASLVVGVNDTMRAGWEPARLRDELMTCAEALHGAGATLLTARFHDHGAVFGLPGVLRRPLHARIQVVNEVYDEVHATYGGHRVDLAARPDVLERAFWSVDRLHPSELGHRALARAYADLLIAAGLDFEPPVAGAAGRRAAGLAAGRGLDGPRGRPVGGPAGPRPRALGGADGLGGGPSAAGGRLG